MAIFAYTEACRAILAGEINLASDDVRVMLVMTNHNGDRDSDTFGDMTLIDEYDGSGYSTPGLALSNQVVTADDANNRGKFDSSDAPAWTLGAGTRSCLALILYKFVTNLGLSIPIAYYDGTGFPFAGTGVLQTFTFHADGVLHLGS